MEIVFVGAGAVGGYFGGRMAQAGRDVSFFLRPRSAAALRSRGLHLNSVSGDYRCPRPRIIEAGSQLRPTDVLFVTCKAEHVRAAGELAAGLVGKSTVVIPLQNGVDSPGALCQVLPSECVVGGLSRIFAERRQAGRIHHVGLAVPSITCGERAGGRSERVGRVVDHLAGVPGMAIDETPDIWSEMWKKLIMVCSVGVVGATARTTLGILLQVPEARRTLENCAAEIESVARASGAEVPEGYAAGQLALYVRLPSDTTASMQRDLERGDASELNEQLGAVLDYGRQAGVSTPVLEALYGALLPGELRARGQLEYAGVGPRASR